jgi:hypothetical protein
MPQHSARIRDLPAALAGAGDVLGPPLSLLALAAAGLSRPEPAAALPCRLLLVSANDSSRLLVSEAPSSKPADALGVRQLVGGGA